MTYQGQLIPITLGRGSLNADKNQSLIDIRDLILATNLSLVDGLIEKEGGSAKVNSSAISGTPIITGLHDWWATATEQRLLAGTDAGVIVKDNLDNFGTSLKTGLALNRKITFTDGGAEATGDDRKCFICTGLDIVQVLIADAASTTNLTTPPADWNGTTQPEDLVLHNGRMWGWVEHRIYGTSLTDHEDYSAISGGVDFPVFPGDGEKIVAARSVRGRLFFWKFPRGIYWLDDSNTDNTKWIIKKLSDSVGMASSGAHVEVDNDVLFMDTSGSLHILSAVEELGDMKSSDLTSALSLLPWVEENVNRNRLDRTQAIYYPIRRQAHFAVSIAGGIVNARRFVVDFNIPQRPRITWSDKDTCEAIALRRDSQDVQRVIVGDDAGFVREIDQTERDIDGSTGYTGEFQIPHTDFAFVNPAYATVRKHGDFIEAIFTPTGNHNLNVDVYHDGVFIETITMNLSGTGGALGSFILGTDHLGGILANIKKRLHGSARRWSFRGYNGTAGQNFKISDFIIHLRPGEDRL